MFKCTSVIVSKNILIKIKPTKLGNFLVWIFGPIGVVKISLKKIELFLMRNHLFMLLFNLFNTALTKKLAYCEGVSHLIKNAVLNINKQYILYVRLRGVGYKVEYKNTKTLLISLGYSHKIYLSLPSFIKIAILKKRIIIWSNSLTKLQQFTHILSGLRKRDPYNGKGILQPHLQKKLKIGKVSRV